MQILARLRQDCDALHRQLHEHPLLRPLDKGELTHTDHYWALKAFRLAYAKLDSRPNFELPEGCPDSPVLVWLDQDLARYQELPQAASTLKNYRSPSEYLGYLYVKQGSSLGGQVISKRLESVLGLRPGQENTFFYGVGKDTGIQWKRFVACLSARESQLSEDAVALSAVEAFTIIRDCCDNILTIKNHAEAQNRAL